MILKINQDAFELLNITDTLNELKKKVEESDNQSFDHEAFVEAVDNFNAQIEKQLSDRIITYCEREYDMRSAAYQALKQLKDEI